MLEWEIKVSKSNMTETESLFLSSENSYLMICNTLEVALYPYSPSNKNLYKRHFRAKTELSTKDTACDS